MYAYVITQHFTSPTRIRFPYKLLLLHPDSVVDDSGKTAASASDQQHKYVDAIT